MLSPIGRDPVALALETVIANGAGGEALRTAQIPASELAFLSEAVDRFDLASAEMQVDLVSQEPPDENGFRLLSFGNPRFWLVDHDGSGFTQRELSYGQKRLLSFLDYLAGNPYACVVDELVNGLHHEWIEACVEELAKRQSFLASQNPLLLDHLQFASAEEAQQSFICCTRERNEKKRAVFRWENMSEEDGGDFYRAYEAGLLHVSEILRMKGLW